MGAAFFVIIVIVAIVVSNVAKGGFGGPYDRLAKKGTPARGILLSVAPTGTVMRRVPVSIESRRVTVDVEVPGQQPYEVTTSVQFPVNLRGDVLPGATVELRVDPKNKMMMAIVGPGATFAAALLLNPGGGGTTALPAATTTTTTTTTPTRNA